MRLMGVTLTCKSYKARGLDMGCGQGWAVMELADQGVEAYGLDLSAELLKKAQEHTSRQNFQRPPIYLLSKCRAISSRNF